MLQTLLPATAALAGVVLLILFAGWAARTIRLARPPGSGRMRVVESLHLDPRANSSWSPATAAPCCS